MSWRWPLSLPTAQPADPVQRVAALARTAVTTLWVVVVAAGIAAFAEAFRYVLLLFSLRQSLPGGLLGFSDALVITSGIVTVLAGLTAGLVVILWLLRARALADDAVGVQSARPEWQVIAGILVPGWNLIAAGTVLAEMEHSILAAEGSRKLGDRPSPSGLVRLWWLSWVVSVVLGATAFLWSFRTSVQALADGVVLHFWVNVAAVVLAVLTLRVVDSCSRLVTPADPATLSRSLVVGLRDVPPAPRVKRSANAPR